MAKPAATLELDSKRENPLAEKQQRIDAMKFVYASGSRPLDGFTIKRGVGVGGFGEVYFAVSDAGKEVALKRVQRNLDVELRGVSQCLNLKHQNLLGLFDIRYDEKGDAWVVMEYVKGESLRDVLERNPHGMPIDQVLRWFQGIAAGVAYLHDHGIVHRDLKPGNIFSDEDLIKIGDYGLSKFISCSRRSGQTESVGTFHYMAPEIGRGSYGKEIDIYALGIILYEMLTGRVPFEGESSQEIIMKHLTAEPDLNGVAPGFREVIRRALVKDPEKRFHDVGEMLSALRISNSPAGDPHRAGAPNGSPNPEVLFINDSNPDIVFGPVRHASQAAGTSAATGRAGSGGGGGGAGGGGAAVFPDRPPVVNRTPPPEPVAAAVAERFQAARRWWNESNLAAPVKVILIVVFSILAVANIGIIFPVAIVLGAVYLVYLGIRSIVLATSAPSYPVRGPAPRADAARRAGPAAPPQAFPASAKQRKRLQVEAVRASLARRSPRDKFSELVGSLLGAATVSAVLSFVGLMIGEQPIDGSVQTWSVYAWLVTTTTFGAWIVLTLSKFWESSGGDEMRRRFTMLVAGLALGGAAFALSQFLGIRSASPPSISVGGSQFAAFRSSAESAVAQLPAYLLYFGALFVLLRWWKQADPLRSSRLSLWDAAVCVLFAYLGTEIWQLFHPWGLLAAGTMSLAVQLAAPWVPQKQRAVITPVA
jgi:hypothetical protein